MGHLSYETILRTHIKDVNRRIAKLERDQEKTFRKIEKLKVMGLERFECAKCTELAYEQEDLKDLPAPNQVSRRQAE